jgi:uncharacterized protein
VLKTIGKALSAKGWEGSLYLNLPPVTENKTITAVPYYTWNNRGQNAMRVWVNEDSR